MKVRQRYSAEFKTEAVRLIIDEGRMALQVAEELGVSPGRLYAWVKQAKIDRGKGPKGALTTAEKKELAALRRENHQLRMERDILKKAAVFFAKESK